MSENLITLPTGEINVNQAFCDMLGYTQKELRNKRWQDITPAEDIEPTQALLESLLQGRKDSVRFNKRYIHKNGSHIWGDVSTAIHRDTDRKPLFFITTVIDITEKKKGEDMLLKPEGSGRPLSTPQMMPSGFSTRSNGYYGRIRPQRDSLIVHTGSLSVNAAGRSCTARRSRSPNVPLLGRKRVCPARRWSCKSARAGLKLRWILYLDEDGNMNGAIHSYQRHHRAQAGGGSPS